MDLFDTEGSPVKTGVKSPWRTAPGMVLSGSRSYEDREAESAFAHYASDESMKSQHEEESKALPPPDFTDEADASTGVLETVDSPPDKTPLEASQTEPFSPLDSDVERPWADAQAVAAVRKLCRVFNPRVEAAPESECLVASPTEPFDKDVTDGPAAFVRQVGTGLTPEGAREWCLIAGHHVEDVSRGVTESDVLAFYKGRPRDLRRHCELCRWQRFAAARAGRDPTLLTAAPDGFPSEAARHRWLAAFLKRRSAVNAIFFRPPRAHYTAAMRDLVILRLPKPHLPLPALWLPAKDPVGLLIFTHGNACDIGQAPIVASYRTSFKMHVLALEWPGYGLAPGQPTEDNLTDHLVATVLFFNRQMKIPFSRIVLFGRSIACGPTVLAAKRLEMLGKEHRVGGMILKSAYLSWKHIMADFGHDHAIAGTAARLLSKLMLDRFKVYEAIPFVTSPTMFIHGKLDNVIPYSHSSRLFGLSGAPASKKRLHIVEHGCHDHGLELWSHVESFIKFLGMAPAPLVSTLPAESYDTVKCSCDAAVASRSRKAVVRFVLQGFIAAVGLACAAWAVVMTTGDRSCSWALRAWLIEHGVTVVLCAAVYAVADWVQDDLARAQDPEILHRCLIALVVLLLFWATDLVFGHIALWTSYDADDCSPLHWWGAFTAMAAVNYVFILKALITNR
ncbi:hypothetical protein DIPPA_23399 [Diplonema papillatum]|nr:hypothetical protein DIPPA_23399 [Diplonema papillatum]